jgi:hypothetical protein
MEAQSTTQSSSPYPRRRATLDHKIYDFATAEDVLKNAAHVGVTLVVAKDRNVITATPAKRVTKELALGIKKHKPQLMRLLLYRQAEEWIRERWQYVPDDIDLTEVREKRERMIISYHDDDLAAYREAVRAYAKAAAALMRKPKRSRGYGANNTA